MLQEVLQRGVFQCSLMGCREIDRGGHTVLQGLLPAGGAKTPSVTRFQAGETIHGHRSGKVISSAARKFQKLFGNDDTNAVNTGITVNNLTTAFTGIARQRIETADFQRSSQYIFMICHVNAVMRGL